MENERSTLARPLALATIVALLGGCATIANDAAHPMRLETATDAGDLVAGADCTLTNDYGSVSAKSGTTLQVRRSGQDLDIACSHPGHPNASGRAISRANAGMFGNIVLGGGIGAIIDHNKGTAYTYPSWIRLVFGKILVFDRSNEKEGQPVPAVQQTANK